jgi:hypothetical protein
MVEYGKWRCNMLEDYVTGRKRCNQRPHTKRQSTQHGCLPSLLGEGDKVIEIVYGERKKIFCTGPIRPAKAEQKSLAPARQAQRTNQERTPFICPLWVPIYLSFNSQQGLHPYLVSLGVTWWKICNKGKERVSWYRICNMEKYGVYVTLRGSCFTNSFIVLLIQLRKFPARLNAVGRAW